MSIRQALDAIPDATGISASQHTTIWAGTGGILASMAQWNWPAIIASTIALLGLAVNIYFLRRRDRREREEDRRREEMHRARLAALRDRCDP